MATINLETLRAVAALLAPHGERISVTLGACENPESLDAMAALQGATTRTTVYSGPSVASEGPYAIRVVDITIGGVTFTRQGWRAATEYEITLLASDSARRLPQDSSRAITTYADGSAR